MATRRPYYVHGVLDAIGHVNVDYYDLDYSDRSQFDRTLTKDELVDVCEALTEETTSTGTVRDLRDLIRDQVDRCPDKSPNSRFSDGELSRITTAIKHTEYLDAEDVNIGELPLLQLEETTLVIDGVTYDVEHIAKDMPAHDEAPYDRYSAFYLNDKRRRLMILENLDMDECRYKHSVVLEEAKDYGPHKRWKRDSYVKEIET